MRKVTAGLFHSVDGVVEAPNEWQYDSFDDQVGAAMGGMMATTDAVLLGRVGYTEWASYWPSSQDPFAGFINGIRKYVFSRTLTGPLEWENAELVEGDLLDGVRTLKQGDGGDIACCAGISLVRQLLFAGLLDGLTLITHPVVAGSGRRLFDTGDPRTRLQLLDSVVTEKGNVIATYAVAPG